VCFSRDVEPDFYCFLTDLMFAHRRLAACHELHYSIVCCSSSINRPRPIVTYAY